jgi:hypothetical protein
MLYFRNKIIKKGAGDCASVKIRHLGDYGVFKAISPGCPPRAMPFVLFLISSPAYVTLSICPTAPTT